MAIGMPTPVEESEEARIAPPRCVTSTTAPSNRMAHAGAELGNLALQLLHPDEQLVQLRAARAWVWRARAPAPSGAEGTGPASGQSAAHGLLLGAPPRLRPAAGRSAPPCGPAGAPGARRARGRSAPRAPARTAARSAKGYMRSERCLSSPGVWGPRSISVHRIASSGRPSGSASASRCRYLAAREPAPLARRTYPRRSSLCRASRIVALVVLDHGVAVGALVARQPQGVQRQRIGVRGGLLLLQQAAEHPDLLRREGGLPCN